MVAMEVYLKLYTNPRVSCSEGGREVYGAYSTCSM